MELLLVSNVVPFNSSMYKVSYRDVGIGKRNGLDELSLSLILFIFLVFCRSACRVNLYNLFRVDDEWICRISMGRRWH